MDKLTCKRKKRRTRRNLDEIRKRTFQMHKNNDNIYNMMKPKVTKCITNGRLTLANKAIRSEIVRRSTLSNIKKRNVIISPNIEEAIDTKDSNINYKKATSPCNINSKLERTLCNYMEIGKSPDSVILFSSSENQKASFDDVSSDSSSSTALTFARQSDNSLYNEFMTNIEHYVREAVPDFLKTDYMHNYIDTFNSKLFQNVIFNNSQNVSGSQMQLNISNKCDVINNLSFTGNNEAASLYPKSQNINMKYLLEEPYNILSPGFHQSQETDLQKYISSSSSAFSGPDSPEYCYYPHRLKSLY